MKAISCNDMMDILIDNITKAMTKDAVDYEKVTQNRALIKRIDRLIEMSEGIAATIEISEDTHDLILSADFVTFSVDDKAFLVDIISRVKKLSFSIIDKGNVRVTFVLPKIFKEGTLSI